MAETSNSTSTKALKVSVEEAFGKLTGNDRVEAEGRHQKRDANRPEVDGPRADKPRAD
ncbi:CsbD family protein [Methylorubrum salsuginis]|uniref:CsbD-like n=1 Tax=Methylorubrum salsuginis TaxID=414703 RepID=A0A1I4G5U4_9HYPH|nr:CsbD family protein [Methylorubrum salsuginis]SFL24850.1 hypothetical protein SAMN04488125_11192 [Methylorubrum salsuginis]